MSIFVLGSKLEINNNNNNNNNNPRRKLNSPRRAG